MHSRWKTWPTYVATIVLEKVFETLSLEGFLIEKLDPPENTLGRLRESMAEDNNLQFR